MFSLAFHFLTCRVVMSHLRFIRQTVGRMLDPLERTIGVLWSFPFPTSSSISLRIAFKTFARSGSRMALCRYMVSGFDAVVYCLK